MIQRCLFFILVASFALQAQDTDNSNLRPFEKPLEIEEPEDIPWIVGNIITRQGFVIPYGHLSTWAASLMRSSDSKYGNNWRSVSVPNQVNVNTFYLFRAGLTQFMDAFFRLEGVYNKTSQASTFGFGDLVAGLSFQLYTYPKDSWLPAVRLVLAEFFPTGKYQHLQAYKDRTDAMGSGSFCTEAALFASHVYQLKGIHHLGVLFNVRYRMFAPVHVHGLNTYGGMPNTNGRVFPGSRLILSQGFEFSLSKRWTVATDLRYHHDTHRRFSGFPGKNSSGEVADLRQPPSDQFVFAPQLEYSWTDDLGAILGAWFTFAGRNAQNYSGIIAQAQYYY